MRGYVSAFVFQQPATVSGWGIGICNVLMQMVNFLFNSLQLNPPFFAGTEKGQNRYKHQRKKA